MDALGSQRRRYALAGLLACGSGWRGALARPRTPPDGLALAMAKEASPGIDPAGYLVSEKCDGVRAVWDGAQLCFRSGLPVHAPEGFIARLPSQPLDGELWLGRGRFEALVGAVRRKQPLESEWRDVRYMLFDLPAEPGGFAARAQALERLARRTGWAQLEALPQTPVAGRAALQRRLDQVVADGGEGLVLHRADAQYSTGRSDKLLKLKQVHDAEATVLAHIPGQGRLSGRLGALRVRTPDGLVFLLGSGFTDDERASPPPPGTVVTYTYRGRTGAGVPRFASFLRVRPDGA
jgi:DNA ligase-1